VLNGQLTIAFGALAGALAALAVMTPRRDLLRAAWILWAGLVTGLGASELFSPELLNFGLIGRLISGAGAFAGALAMSIAWEASRGLHGSDRTSPHDPKSNSTRWRVWHRGAAAAAVSVLALLLAAAGLPIVSALGLILLASVGAARRPCWSLSLSCLVVLAVLSAAVIIGSRLVLSPFGLVGDPLATVALLVLGAAPFVMFGTLPDDVRPVVARIGVMDAAAMTVAVVAGLAWSHVFHGLNRFQTMAQLSQLGEDNNAHLLMLQATQRTDSALGTTAESLAVTSNFSGYFPGPSLWQSAVGALLPATSTPHLYVLSTSILIAVLAGGTTAFATLGATRTAAGAALAVICVGMAGVRLTLAQYEFGFPGQLLTAIWLVAALALVVLGGDRAGRLATAAGLGAFALAATWTWSLAAPLFLLPVVAWLFAAGWKRATSRQRVALAGLLVVALGAAAYVGRHKIVDTLNTLNIDGPVFRAVPIWLALALILTFPIAMLLHGRMNWAVSSLALGTGLATLGLSGWQLARLGHATYYSYKLQYLTLALAWAALVIIVATTISRREIRLPTIARVLTAVLAVALCVPLLASPSQSYDHWLTERGVIQPSPTLACAERKAASAPDGTIALAVGYGSATADYLTTKALINGSVSDASVPFFTPLFTGTIASSWPWVPNQTYVIVPGPGATTAQTRPIVTAGAAAGASVSVASRCG
jgi:hypothetical protein